MPGERRLHVVEPADLGLDGEEVVLQNELTGHVATGADGAGLSLQAVQVAQLLHGGGALRRDCVPHVHAGYGHRHRQLDDEFVARRTVAADRGEPPLSTSANPRVVSR